MIDDDIFNLEEPANLVCRDDTWQGLPHERGIGPWRYSKS